MKIAKDIESGLQVTVNVLCCCTICFSHGRIITLICFLCCLCHIAI